MSDLFISYANADLGRVKPIVDALEHCGWSVWWDRTILAGKTWDKVIESALDDAACVIVLWSHISVASEWVRIEAEEARRRGILVPVLLDDVKIPLAFRMIQAARLVDWTGTLPDPAFDELSRAVTDVLRQKTPAPPQVSTAPPPFAVEHDRQTENPDPHIEIQASPIAARADAGVQIGVATDPVNSAVVEPAPAVPIVAVTEAEAGDNGFSSEDRNASDHPAAAGKPRPRSIRKAKTKPRPTALPNRPDAGVINSALIFGRSAPEDLGAIGECQGPGAPGRDGRKGCNATPDLNSRPDRLDEEMDSAEAGVVTGALIFGNRTPEDLNGTAGIRSEEPPATRRGLPFVFLIGGGLVAAYVLWLVVLLLLPKQ